MGEDGGSSCTARVGCLWAPCVGRGGGADGCRVPVSGCARLVRVGGGPGGVRCPVGCQARGGDVAGCGRFSGM